MDDDLLLGLAAAFENNNDKSKPSATSRPPPRITQPGYIPSTSTASIPPQKSTAQQRPVSQAQQPRKLDALRAAPSTGFKSSTKPAPNALTSGVQDNGQGNYISRRFSIKMKNPTISRNVLEYRLSNHMTLKLSSVKTTHFNSGLQGGNWYTVAIIGEKSPPKQTSNGRSYSIWKLTDLDQTMITLFVFGKAYEDNWRETEGTVVALIGAKIRAEDGDFSLAVDSDEQLMVLGRATDFGYCKAKQKNGQPCRIPVNINSCPYCQYHVASEYNRMRPSRKELQGGALATAFKLPNGTNALSSTGRPINQTQGLQWKPGNFETTNPNSTRVKLTAATPAQLQEAAKLAAQRGSNAGARYVQTVADPAAAKAAAVDAERKKREKERYRGNGAPIPLPRMSTVTLEQRPPPLKTTTSLGGKPSQKRPRAEEEETYIDLEDEEDEFMLGAEALAIRKKAAAILAQKRAQPQKAQVPALLAKSVEVHTQKQQKTSNATTSRNPLAPTTAANKPLSSSNAAGRSTSNSTQLIPKLSKTKTTTTATQPSAFELAFGSIIEEVEKTRDNNDSSRYGSLIAAEEDAVLDATFNAFLQRDQAAAKMDGIKSLEVNAWKCSVCNDKMTAYRPKHCAEAHPHALSKVKATKRWWQCQGCKKRFDTVGVRFFTGRCPKCDVPGTDFVAVSMLRPVKDVQIGEAKIASKEAFKVRGVEQKWVN